ncbi:hypothetical protein OCK74_17855 [Chitinophagaceae bacterium LB-8]|uniref:Uncharacterized protein n=1 Tax=Paraflavisolibacter caeni TaxID=2982496 RepID=A0A9X3BJC0_9BACT|nr:hypothetical protein [Paraflavisolibacter caeni]MCU7550988.1 hypothetical protein [Paraflavisolibacter caeni]
MKPRIILASLVIVVFSYFIVNIMFKVNYANRDVGLLDSLQMNDSITIPKSYIVLGRNYKGFIEATILPAQEHRYNDKGIVEYYYLRFHPDWFKTHIAPRITSYLPNKEKLSFDLVAKARDAHEDNFGYCCHFNDYPIVSEGILFARISLLGVADKITVFTDAKMK